MLHTVFFKVTGLLVPEKICLILLPYMDIAAILMMWPGPFEQTLFPLFHGSSIWNLTLIDQSVSDEKIFKIVWTTDDDARRRMIEALSAS